MKYRGQVVFDIGAEKFKYLHREDGNKRDKVDIIDLNRRLNENRKINLYTNAKIIAASLICIVVVAFISLNF